MVLYRSEWQKVLTNLQKIPKPVLELHTLAQRVELAIQTKTSDPFGMSITEYQTSWVESRCHLVTLHRRKS